MAFPINNSPKHNPEPCQAVRIRPEGERTIVFLEHFADKYQADALTTTFGGKERAEQFGFRFLINAFAGVGNFQTNRITGGPDVDLTIVADRFGSILDDVDQYLFEKRIIQIDNR